MSYLGCVGDNASFKLLYHLSAKINLSKLNPASIIICSPMRITQQFEPIVKNHTYMST